MQPQPFFVSRVSSLIVKTTISFLAPPAFAQALSSTIWPSDIKARGIQAHLEQKEVLLVTRVMVPIVFSFATRNGVHNQLQSWAIVGFGPVFFHLESIFHKNKEIDFAGLTKTLLAPHNSVPKISPDCFAISTREELGEDCSGDHTLPESKACLH